MLSGPFPSFSENIRDDFCCPRPLIPSVGPARNFSLVFLFFCLWLKAPLSPAPVFQELVRARIKRLFQILLSFFPAV